MEKKEQSARRPFAHRKLKVYQKAASFMELAHHLIAFAADGNGALMDQLRRASVSICLNIAEGAGEYSRKEKARFYRMARRSATECAAIMDICRRLEIGPAERLQIADSALLEVEAMLTAMIKNLNSRSRI